MTREIIGSVTLRNRCHGKEGESPGREEPLDQREAAALFGVLDVQSIVSNGCTAWNTNTPNTSGCAHGRCT
jgi:hypothetical protein